MLLGYCILSVIFVLISIKYYSVFLNPISIYSIVWIFAILIHQSGLIYYNELLPRTWIFITISYIFFCGFSLLHKPNSFPEMTSVKDDRNIIKKYLIITLLIASLGILSSIVNIISIYGTNLLYNLTNIYAARVYDNVDFQVIPYVGSFIYIALPLAGIYVRRFGVSIWIMYAFVLIALNSLTSGARAGIVFSLLLFVYGFTLSGNKSKVRVKTKSNKIGLYIGSLILVAFFVIVSQSRAAGNQLPYATDVFYKYFGDNALLYKLFAYVANPVGVLNEYLKECDFYFGKNTFLPLYNIIAKFGIIDRIDQYQSWYSVPADCNVGTWLRELIEDFTWAGAIIAVSIFSYITSKVYIKSIKLNQTSSIIISSILLMMVTLSFFDWKLRTSGLWIALIFGSVIGNKIDRHNLQVDDGRHTDTKL